LLSHERQCFSCSNTFGTTPTACLRFAILSRIIFLLEHSYDSQRNKSAAQLADFIGGSQSREARILFSPLRQFQRRVAVGGSVAHLVARDTSFPLITSRATAGAPGSQAFSGRSAPDQPKVPWRESQSSRR